MSRTELNDEEFVAAFRTVSESAAEASAALTRISDAVMALREVVRKSPLPLSETPARFEVFSKRELHHALARHLIGEDVRLRPASLERCSSPVMRWDRLGYVNPGGWGGIRVVESLDVPAGVLRAIGTEGQVLADIPMWRKRRKR